MNGARSLSVRLAFGLGAMILLVMPPYSIEGGAKPDRRPVPRRVLAFYYPWYGNPQVSGRWVHWDGVDPKGKRIGCSTNYPAKGAYDSHDPKLIDRHIKEAEQNGIGGFICSWWGRRDFTDRAFVKILDRVGKKDFKVSLYWERVRGRGKQMIAAAAEDLVYILANYGDHPAFLKVDGKPVIFVYIRVMQQIPSGQWADVIGAVRKKHRKDFLLIADGYSDANAKAFGGIHTYNIAGKLRSKPEKQIRDTARALYGPAVALARRHGKIACVTVIPGYDDTKVRKPGLTVDRFDGQLYKTLWEQAVAAKPDWILITSWNEWHEGSEIEASLEHGDKYLRITRDHAGRFKSKTSRKPKD